jgi:hypothetical protein
MNETKKLRKIWLTIRLNNEEQKRLKGLYNITTCKALSEYARDILLQRPVVINYQNQSVDETLSEMGAARNRAKCNRKILQPGGKKTSFTRPFT